MKLWILSVLAAALAVGTLPAAGPCPPTPQGPPAAAGTKVTKKVVTTTTTSAPAAAPVYAAMPSAYVIVTPGSPKKPFTPVRNLFRALGDL